MRKPSPKQQARAVDALLTSIYGRHCHGQIGVLDISKVFKAGERIVLALAREASALGTVPFNIENCRDAATVAMRAKFEELRYVEPTVTINRCQCDRADCECKGECHARAIFKQPTITCDGELDTIWVCTQCGHHRNKEHQS